MEKEALGMDTRTWKIAEDLYKEHLAWAEHERLACQASESNTQEPQSPLRWIIDKAALLFGFAGRVWNLKPGGRLARDVASELNLIQAQFEGVCTDEIC